MTTTLSNRDGNGKTESPSSKPAGTARSWTKRATPSSHRSKGWATRAARSTPSRSRAL